MNKLDIFCFTSVARTKNFSITARELRISQQAVSKHIKNLEDELGYPLFFRDMTPLELTKAGTYMLEYFTIRSQLSETIRKEFDPEDQSRSLKIGFSQWIGTSSRFLEIIKAFHSARPDIKMHLMVMDAREMNRAFSEKSADLLFSSKYSASYIPSTWNKIKVSSQPLYLIKSRTEETQEDYASCPFFAPYAGEDNENSVKARVLRTCRQLGFSPRSIQVCPDIESALLNVLLNRGITLGAYCQDQGNSGEYIFEATGLMADILLCFPRISSKPAAEQFAAFFKEYLARSEEMKNE